MEHFDLKSKQSERGKKKNDKIFTVIKSIT